MGKQATFKRKKVKESFNSWFNWIVHRNHKNYLMLVFWLFTRILLHDGQKEPAPQMQCTISKAAAHVHDEKSFKMLLLLRIFPFFLLLRGHFSVCALEYVNSHPPQEEKSSLQDFSPTGTPTVYVALCEIYCTVCASSCFMWYTQHIRHAPYPVNPPESQSLRSLSHLRIMQASWRWNCSVKKSSARYELWDGPNWAIHLRPETGESEGKSCVVPVLQLSSSDLSSLSTHC